jgi:Uma2 family endonuclease
MKRDAEGAGAVYPRAPTEEEWARLSATERAAVVEALPAAMTDAEASPPEGDLHYDAKNDARATLREWYRRRGLSVYVAAELTTYYPGQDRFAPDVLAVRDVPVHDRMKWVVSAEGKGLDWVLEVHVGGDRKKDNEHNVVRYARLGIPEYFIYDRARQQLLGYRLPSPDARTYVRIVPQGGLYPSEVLGLELAIQDERLRFYQANAELLPPQELAERLERMLAQMSAERDAEAERAKAEAERARLAEDELARLREELERTRRERE